MRRTPRRRLRVTSYLGAVVLVSPVVTLSALGLRVFWQLAAASGVPAPRERSAETLISAAHSASPRSLSGRPPTSRRKAPAGDVRPSKSRKPHPVTSPPPFRA